MIIGAGGHAKVVLDAALQAAVHGRFAVFSEDNNVKNLLGTKVLNSMPEPSEWPVKDWEFHVAIGDNKTRRNVAAALLSKGYAFASITHPKAVVSPHARLGDGVGVLANAVINAGAAIANGAIINTSAIVEHDCILGGFCHISPGAVLAGGVSVGESSWIGANATIRQNTRIGDDVILGAHGFTSKSLLQAGTYIGNPAGKLNQA